MVLVISIFSKNFLEIFFNLIYIFYLIFRYLLIIFIKIFKNFNQFFVKFLKIISKQFLFAVYGCAPPQQFGLRTAYASCIRGKLLYHEAFVG